MTSSYQISSEKESSLRSQIDPEKLPRHIAFIMDGNGRWAKQRKFPRVAGHRKGIETVRRVIRCCRDLGISTVTLYAFSAENWSRSSLEVSTLMRLLRIYLRREVEELNQNNVRLETIGRIDEMDSKVQEAIKKAKEKLRHNTKFTLCLALNYGGRNEILDASKKAARAVQEGKLNIEDLNESSFRSFLYLPELPDPDLVVRTSGELRISNFLLWQIAYSEIYITPVFWPDFSRENLYEAVLSYQKRERRFGGVSNE